VSLSPSTYADLWWFYSNSNNPLTFITIENTHINPTNPLFQLKIPPRQSSQIGNYQLAVRLVNDQGISEPYLVNINVINTPPQYKGKAELSIIAEVSVRVNEKYVLELPDIINLENQTLFLSLSDQKTDKTYPFITVRKPDLLELTFEPKDKEFVGNHMLSLVLSDELEESTSYMLKMKILPLTNIGAPSFSPVPD
jgi:hypothetical protein